MEEHKKVSTDPYKGVRDFYPEDQFVQRYIFEHMERVCELFGYEEYNASVLEPAELYRSKTSEEIVNEQTYTFTDRGDREVTLRAWLPPVHERFPCPHDYIQFQISSVTTAHKKVGFVNSGNSTPIS
jgi:prolyl-tRNA synthetase